MGCAGAAAASVEVNLFEPFGVEALGPWGPSTRFFYRYISKRLINSSRDSAGLLE